MKNKYYHVKVLLKIFLLNGHNSFHGIKIYRGYYTVART